MGAYKVANASGDKRFGICCKDFNELLRKGCEKMKINKKQCDKLRVTLEDGTEVDEEYFSTIEQHTLLVFLLPGEKLIGYELGQLEQFFALLLSKSSGDNRFQETLQKLIKHTKSSPEKTNLIMNILESAKGDIDAEDRDSHPDWFEGVESRAKTKTAAMRNRAQQRIRGYLNDFKKAIENETLNKSTKKEIDELRENFVDQLKSDGYFGCFFMRSDVDLEQSYCEDKRGWFACQGEFDKDDCEHSHLINPYHSKEHRIVFSTWNLDHVVEKKRNVIPSIVQAAQNIPHGKKLNWKYFYSLLFTKNNLKLVHVVCHKKDEHKSHHCDPKKFYVAATT